MAIKRVRASDLFAPNFKEVWEEFLGNKITHFMLKGGRGSTKSTAVSTMIEMGMMMDAARGEVTNAIVLRLVGDTLRASAHAQMIKSTDLIGNPAEWKPGYSPLTLKYKINGATVQFHGVDDPTKLKSITPERGYFKYIWLEEAAEFQNMEHVRSVLQSVMRGGEVFKVFYTYNPPRDVTHWINVEADIPRPDRLVHHSTYLDVPSKWLPRSFYVEAETLKKNNLPAYEHEYLGISTGVEGQIFKNVKLETITARQILDFRSRSCGLDWGYSIDPLAVIWDAWNPKYRRLYLFDEVYKLEMSNTATVAAIQEKGWRGTVICDSEDPKSIADINGMGVRGIPARKGPGSVDRGMRWLSRDVDEIIIDPVRCPNAVKEFKGYSFDKDQYGKYKKGYPDRDNHLIDATRYSAQDWMAIMRIR